MARFYRLVRLSRHAHAPDDVGDEITNVVLAAGRGECALRIGDRPQLLFELTRDAVEKLE